MAIFEDEHLIALELRHRLQRLGLDIAGHWSSARVGLDALAGTQADVVLMDVNLENQESGIEATRHVVDHLHLPVVMLTAHADRDTVARARDAGAFGFLVKPPHESTLLATVTMAVENGRLARQLRAHQVELERSNRDLEAFAAIAAHDIRTPVAQVRSLIDLLELDGALTDLQVEHLTDMRASTDRALALAQKLLLLAKIDGMRAPEDRVSLDDVFDDVRHDMAQALAQAGARIDVGPMPAAVRGDAIQLHDLFLNLLTNALKFRVPSRPLQVDVHGEVSHGQLRVVVADNGLGFSDSDAAVLFRPLSRLASVTHVEGTGLGLATCARIAQRHGGSIGATGRPGLGATFEVCLPLATG